MAIDLSQLGIRSGQTNDGATRANDLLTQISALLQQYVAAPDADPTVSAAFQQLGQTIAAGMGGGSSEDMSGGAAPDVEDQMDQGADEASEGQDPMQGMAQPSDSYSQANKGAAAFLKSKKAKAA